MESPTQYWAVNWEDGMKINRSHFLAEQNAQAQELIYATGTHVTHVNYGLLPPVATTQQHSKLHVSLDNQQMVQLRLGYCRAVTAGGALIHVSDEVFNNSALQAPVPGLSVSFQEMKARSSVFYAVLTVNPYQRIPAGQADPQETPPRLPFSVPDYTLSLLPQESLRGQRPGLYHLIIGRLLLDEHQVQLDEKYIPPCVTTSSYPDLLEIFSGLEQFFGQMELYSLQILQKIHQRKQQNEMALIVHALCQNLVQYNAAHAMLFRWSAMHQPPLYMLSQVASLARLVKNTLDQYIGSGKEELMNYLAEWCDVKQADLEGVITDLTNHAYNHQDCNETVVKMYAFTKLISLLFQNLSKLDYIGKRRDANIFVKEEMVMVSDATPAEIKAKKRSSFLAD